MKINYVNSTKEIQVKPIPKYIQKKITAADKKINWTLPGSVRFYAYMTKVNGNLAKITVAVKTYHKELYMKQIAIHIMDYESCLVKDLEYSCYLGMGWRVGWHDMGIQNYAKNFEKEIWEEAHSKYYDPYCFAIFNKEIITKIEKYKYSAINLYNGNEIFKYLKLYEKYPQIEYLMKVGPKTIALNKQILEKCSKDKNFCKWLIANKEELNKKYYYISTILKSYKTGIDLCQMQKYEEFRYYINKNIDNKEFKDEYRKDIIKLYDYIHEQNTNEFSYEDYYVSCIYLNIDMSIPKNRYPHDFKKWHDIRTDEYHTAKTNKEKELKEHFKENFEKVAEKYAELQYNGNKNYICIIAKSPEDLIKEGQVLHHCVGRMNYDQKFVREETLIFFVRNKNTPETPFVTLEYSTTSHKVLQCYGEHDSKPNEDVLKYVNKTWLPYANKQIKQIAA